MTSRVFIVTGGLRGLGRAMTIGLAANGYRVVAAGHIQKDVDLLLNDPRLVDCRDRIVAMVADIREPATCDQVVAASIDHFGRLDGLVNNAGLTFTYISPDGKGGPGPRFWDVRDEITQNVVNTNYIAAAQMAKRVAAHLVPKGWGRNHQRHDQAGDNEPAGHHPVWPVESGARNGF